MKKIIVLSVATVAILTFSGCGNDKKAAEATQTATQQAAETTKNATEAVKEAANKTVEAAKETASKAAEAVKESAQKAAEATKEAASNVVNKAAEEAKEVAKKAAESTKEVANKAANAVKEATASNDNSKGQEIYKRCVSCHGADGKTKALGKSEVIAGQNADDLVKKIEAYKAGTRNVAGMGALMKGQVGSLSDEEIKAVAAYISSLK